MALADTAKLVVDLSLKGNYVSGVGKAIKATDALDRSSGRAFKAGQQIGRGILNTAKLAAVGVGILASQIGFGIQSLSKLEQANLQTAAVIKSTGKAAGVSAFGVRRLAEEFENLNALMDDKVIQAGENLLLTFTRIRGKMFKPTLEAALDMNTALGGGPEGLQQTMIQLGKAMNDPERGLTALRRVGVAFTKDQLKQIKALAKSGDLLGAQRIILKELNKEFGGSFKKQGESAAATAARFGKAIEDAQMSLAKGMLPVVRKVADALTALFKDPGIQKGINDLGTGVASLFTDQNISSGIGILKTGFDAVKDAAPGIIAGAKIAGAVVSTAVAAFRSLPPEIQKLAIGAAAVNKLTGGLITNIGGGIFDRLFARGSSPANPMWVAMAGGPGGLPMGGKPGGPPSGVVTPAIGAGIAVDTNWLWQFYHDELDKIHAKLTVSRPAQINPDRIDDAIQHRIDAAAAGLLSQRHGEQGGGAGGPNHVTPHAVGTGVITAPIHELAGAVKALGAGLREQRRGEFGGPLGGAAIHHALPPGHDVGGITAAAINNQATVLKGLSQIEDRRGTDTIAAVQRRGEQTVGSVNQVRSQVSSTGNYLASATQAASANIVAAIWAARPIVNVTNITKSTTIQQRYGPSNGSYGQQAHSGGAGAGP